MDVKQGYKQTEVGVIPADWDVLALTALTTDIGDGIHATPIYSASGDYFFINGNNISDGKIVITTETKAVNQQEFKKHRKGLGENTILLSINGTIGNLGLYAGEPVVLGKSAAYLNIKKEADKTFIYYYLQTKAISDQFDDGLTGTTIRNLSLATIRNTQVALPPTKAEQEAIAAALSDADALIESLTQLIAKKRQIKQGAMQELLTGKRRLPGFATAGSGYQQTEVGVIPEDWVIAKLSSVCGEPMQNGVFYKPSHKGTGVKLINVGDLYKGIPIDTESLELFDADESEKERFKVKDGDLFFTRSSVVPSGIAHCNIFRSNRVEPVVFDSHVIRFRPNTNQVNASYLFRFCVSYTARNYLVSHAKTATMTTIDQGVLGKCPVLLPPIAEQEAIAEVLSEMDAELAALEAKLTKARALKLGMMHNLLTGRIRLV